MTKILFDKFLISLLAVIVLAHFFPLQGVFEIWFSYITKLAIGILFFLHGARLSRDSVRAGIIHWRLHLAVLSCTFLLFPLLGVLAVFFSSGLAHSPFYIGILYLCILPSTVQSSIAFTSLAGGNVSAAIVCASASNILGVFITPLLVGLFLSTNFGSSAFSFDIFLSILVQLFIPFLAGQLLQPWWGEFLQSRKKITNIVDRGSILMVVFLAFSQAANSRIWENIALRDIGTLIAFNIFLLSFVLIVSWFGAKWLGFNRSDRITIMFCGSKKSLASGVPMANVIFAQSSQLTLVPNIGVIILPIMLFHQIQLMACTIIAQYLNYHAKGFKKDYG